MKGITMMETMNLDKIFMLVGQYGLPIVLVAYFIWRDYVREQRAVAKEAELICHIQGLEQEMRELLMDLVAKTSSIIVANSVAMQDWLKVLQIRPCLADELARKIIEETIGVVKDARDGKYKRD